MIWLSKSLIDGTQTHGSDICESLVKALTTSKANSEALRNILTSLSIVIRLAPLPTTAPVLLDSGIFQHILTALEDDKASGINLAAYLDVLMRIAIIEPNVFVQMVIECARRTGRDGEKVLEETLDAIWRNFDYVGESRGRKAVAMGAASLLTTVSSALYSDPGQMEYFLGSGKS